MNDPAPPTQPEQKKEKNAMAQAVEGHEVSVEIDQGRPLSVGQEGIEVLRGEANAKANHWLLEAYRLWDDCDVSDYEQVCEIKWTLGMASDAVDALWHLCAIPDEDGPPA